MKDFLSEHPFLSMIIVGMCCVTVMYVADACVDAVDIAHRVVETTKD